MKNKKIEFIFLPAKNGDSFFIKVDGVNILLDTGYVDTYNNHIEPQLVKLKDSGEKLSRLIITHIDEDHIRGAIDFLENNEDNNIIEIEQVWHNSYRHLANLKEEASSKLSKEGERILKSIPDKKSETKTSNKQISARQGSSLAGLILARGYKWNKDFEEKVITNSVNSISLSESVKIRVISPDTSKTKKLEKFWRKELSKIGFKDHFSRNDLFDDAFEFLLKHEKKQAQSAKKKQVSLNTLTISNLLKEDFKEDNTPTNGSSIAFILEYHDKKLLFLGDSHPSVITTWLKEHYLKKADSIFFDLIKVSHHGSFANNSPELFTLIDSDKFIISTNGNGHGHPDLETLAWIVSRKSEQKRTIYFNYENDGYTFLKDSEMKKEFNYEVQLSELDTSQSIFI